MRSPKAYGRVRRHPSPRAWPNLKSASEPIDDSPIGRGMELFLAWQADFQLSHNVAKIKTNLLKKMEIGSTPGKAPIGYKNVRENYHGRMSIPWR